MRRLELGLAMLFMTITAYGKGKSGLEYGSTIGISMSAGAVRKQTELSIGHAFSPHWSVSGRTSIALSHFFKERDKEEYEHYAEFKEIHVAENVEMFSGCASVIYWPTAPYEKIYFRTGCRIEGISWPHIESAIGYFFRIWRNLYADISYETSMNGGKISGNGVSICIHIKF